MTKAFVFAGNDTVGNMVADRLCGAGWQRVGDAGAADAVLTFRVLRRTRSTEALRWYLHLGHGRKRKQAS